MSDLKLSILAPDKKLKPFVRRILLTTGETSKKELLPIGPTGYSYLTYSRYPNKLVFSNKTLMSDKQLYLAGQLSEEQPHFEIEGPFFHIGLEMSPMALYYFFDVEGAVDGGILLEDIDKELSDTFRREFANEKDPEKIARGLEKIIEKKLPGVAPNRVLDHALAIIIAESGHISVNELVKRIEVSERHFRREFKRIIGIGPKQYCKIIQFNSAFEAIQTDNAKKVYDVALKCGYYDHSHFINDFKRLLGQSPRQFLKSDHDFLKNYLGAYTLLS